MYKKYIEELKNGKQIRIKYNKQNHDYCEEDGWWSEELWCYDNNLGSFKCYYPVSSYEKNFYTAHVQSETESFLRESIRDSDNEYGDATVVDIIVKDCNIPIRIFDEPYFMGRIRLYDKFYGTVEKWNIFVEELQKYSNEQQYFEDTYTDPQLVEQILAVCDDTTYGTWWKDLSQYESNVYVYGYTESGTYVNFSVRKGEMLPAQVANDIHYAQ